MLKQVKKLIDNSFPDVGQTKEIKTKTDPYYLFMKSRFTYTLLSPIE